MACGQRCAIALVEREIASAEEIMRERAPAPLRVRLRPREDRVYVPRRVAYVSVVQFEPCSARE